MSLENSWIFPVVESIHVMGLAAFVGATVLEDLRTLEVVHWNGASLKPWAHSGLAALLLTGFVMFLSDAARYLHNPAFQVKLALLVAALAAHFTVRRPGRRSGAIVSLILWTCVTLAARAIIDFDV
jgi:hypothetical protein